MFKKITNIFLVSVLFISPVFANNDIDSAFSQQGYFAGDEPMGKESLVAKKASIQTKTGGYIGVRAGGGFSALKPELSKTDGGGTTKAKNNGDEKSAINFDIGVYTGYGTNFNRFYIGGELSASYNTLDRSIKDKIGSDNVELVVKAPVSGGLDIIPGYFFGSARDILLYGRVGLGANWTQLKFSDEESGGKKPSGDRFRLGYRAGLGMEFLMSDNFSWRIEYIYNLFNSYDITRDYKDDGLKYKFGLGSTHAHTASLGVSFHY